MPVLGRRTVRTRGTLSNIVKVPGCGDLRVVSLAKDAHWSMTFDNALVQSSRRQHIAAQRQQDAERAAAEDAEKTPEELLQQAALQQQAEVERKVALGKWRFAQLQMLRVKDVPRLLAVQRANVQKVIQKLRVEKQKLGAEKRKLYALMYTEKRKQQTAERRLCEQQQAEKRQEEELKAVQLTQLTAEAAAEETPALCADVHVEERQKRSAALAAKERIIATNATLAAPEPMQDSGMQLFRAAGRKLRDAFNSDATIADLVNKPKPEVSSWSVKKRAGMVRDFFRRAGVNAPVGIDVRDSLQNNGKSGKGGFLAGKIARNAGTVLGLILPQTMLKNEPSFCMGEPWQHGVQREFGQLLGGVFNTKLDHPDDQEINAAIYPIGPTVEPGVHLAAVILIKKVQADQEIILKYDNNI